MACFQNRKLSDLESVSVFLVPTGVLALVSVSGVSIYNIDTATEQTIAMLNLFLLFL
jgi:hypothetical protein